MGLGVVGRSLRRLLSAGTRARRRPTGANHGRRQAQDDGQRRRQAGRLGLGAHLQHPQVRPVPSASLGLGAMEGADQDPRCASNRLSDRCRLISWLSQGSTLPAGTVIITGTPPGVGTGSKPAQFLRDGDDVRCSISHGMGAFRQSKRLLERRRLTLGSSRLTRPSRAAQERSRARSRTQSRRPIYRRASRRSQEKGYTDEGKREGRPERRRARLSITAGSGSRGGRRRRGPRRSSAGAPRSKGSCACG